MDNLSIYSLPFEVLAKILNNLPFRQLIANRIVCKKFRFVIHNFVELDSLLIYDTKIAIAQRLPHNFQLINYPNSIRVSNGTHLKNCQLNNYSVFLKIKHLCVHDDAFLDVDCDFLNLYQNLEILRINFLIVKLNANKLKHRNLKVLDILCVGGSKVHSATLDLPKLETLKIKQLDIDLDFIHPQTINWAYLPATYDFIEKFTNLEYLFLDTVDQFDFTCLPVLKVLDFYEEHYSPIRLSEIRTQFLSEQFSSDLNIFFCGINIRSISLPQIRNNNVLELICSNHLNLSPVLFFVETVNYSYLEGHFDEIRDALIIKFVKLRELVIDSTVRKPDQLDRFLNCHQYLETLCFRGSKLDQRFYNQLAIVTPLIQHLIIVDDLNIIDNLNLDFMMKFEFLIDFTTNRHLTIAFLESVFNKMNSIQFVHFKLRRSKVTIIRVDELEVKLNDGPAVAFTQYKSEYKNHLT